MNEWIFLMYDHDVLDRRHLYLEPRPFKCQTVKLCQPGSIVAANQYGGSIVAVNQHGATTSIADNWQNFSKNTFYTLGCWSNELLSREDAVYAILGCWCDELLSREDAVSPH